MSALFRSLRTGLAGCARRPKAGLAASALVSLTFVLSAMGAAAKTPDGEDIARWSLRLSEIEARLDLRELGAEELDVFRRRLDGMGDELKARIAARQAELTPLEAGLAQLGPAPAEGAPESPRAAGERARLTNRIAILSDDLGLSRNLLLNLEGTLARAVAMRREMFRDRLLNRSRGVFEPGVLARGVEALGGKLDLFKTELGAGGESTAGGPAMRALGALAVLGLLFLIFRAKDRVTGWLTSRVRPGGRDARNAAASIGLTLARLVLPTAAIGLCALWLSRGILDGPLGLEILRGLAWSAVLVVGAYGLGAAFFAPGEPALRISRLDDREARGAHLWLMALALTAGADRLLVERGAASLGLAFETLTVLNTLLLIPGGVALWMLARALLPTEAAETGTPPEEEGEKADPALTGSLVRFFGVAVRFAAAAAPVLALLGYFAASRYIFYSIVFSGIAIGVGVVLFHAVNEAVARMGDETGSERRGLRSIPVAFAFFMICAAVPALLLIWGATAEDLQNWWKAVEEGVSIGEIVLSPVDLATFLIVFSIGYVATRTVQGALSRSVLPLTGLDAGGRDAVTAGTGYVGIFIAALIAVSTTGLDLSNIAIVAGALSVGIGFGLQNIVNNFISGVILLIERPIKAGDWVELASGMGYVKKVNVRSTEVQTFDRSTLFVPNSELISAPVVNWTHADMHGRLIVKVGVAYGTDPRKVEKILQEIADGHAMLFRRPAPYVLFRGFGADSLDFEIRGVLRDVNWILNVQSDINFAIAEKFAEAGIDIPFAQRDVRIKNLHELGQGIAGTARPAPAPPGK